MTERMSYPLGKEELIIETGKMAKQANGSVYVEYAGSAVLATVCCSSSIIEGLDYVPLQVEYNEKAYAAGKAADTVILDVNNEEDQAGQADLPIGYMPNLEKITLLQLDGVLTPDEYKKCIEIGIDGCKQVYEIQKKALQEKYFSKGDND